MDKEKIKSKIEEIDKKIKESEEILNSLQDKELIEIAKEDLKKFKKEKEELLKQINKKETINEIIMEIRAGAGGEEAALFAADLFRMYLKFAVKKGFSIKILDQKPTSLGGIKQIVFEVKGKNCWDFLKYEGGTRGKKEICSMG